MFGAEIKPYLEYIKVWKQNQAIPNRNILEKMRDVYDEYIKDEKLAKTSLGCGGCVKHMMNQLVGAVDRLGQEPIKLEPKIPHLEPKELDNYPGILSQMQEDPIEIVESPNIEKLSDAINEVFVGGLKWGEFKKYCKESGLSVKGKTRKELMRELGFS
jgi:hypothetical protein